MSIRPATPVLLAFDTSTEQMAVSLAWGGGLLAVDAPGGAAASAALLPQVHALLAQAGLGLQDVDAVAFGQGPGAFTGLRTACAVAQGLAFGLGCRLLPIDSLLIVAEDARVLCDDSGAAGFRVMVAMDARMDEAYAASYAHGPAGWQMVAAPALLSLPALAEASAAADAPACRAGSAWQVHAARLPVLRSQISVLTGQGGGQDRRAAALARLALAAWHAGAAVDPALALPVYLRDKVAQTSSERLAARLLAAGTMAP